MTLEKKFCYIKSKSYQQHLCIVDNFFFSFFSSERAEKKCKLQCLNDFIEIPFKCRRRKKNMKNENQFHYINLKQVLTTKFYHQHRSETLFFPNVKTSLKRKKKHFQCSKLLNLRILFQHALFKKSICDSCKRNGKKRKFISKLKERKKPKRIYPITQFFFLS